MGSSNWSSSAYDNLKSDYQHQTKQTIFNSIDVHDDLNPKGLKFRESRDSIEHPNSLAIAVFLDVTGSMGDIPEFLIKNKLGTLMETLIKHKVEDSHVLFAGIGDHYADKGPLQVGQFEAGTEELNDCLTKIWLEGQGGGQGMESYQLAWLIGARHTSIDCFEKRNQKGFLFTIGDENVHSILEKEKVEELLGYNPGENMSSEALLQEVQRMYHVYHLLITETSTGRIVKSDGQWQKLLGEHCLIVDDSNMVAEIIATTVAVVNGANIKDVVSDFDSHTAQIVTRALAKVNTDVANKNEGVFTL